MSDLRKAAEMALEFVDWLCGDDHSVKPKNKSLDVRESLRQALAQPEQECEWVSLTDEEIKEIEILYYHDKLYDIADLCREVEKRLMKKNIGGSNV